MAMNAAAQSLIGMITGANSRFVIPVYQRPYSWDEDQRLQLWDDVISVGKRPSDRHFTGSVVWVQDGTMSTSGVTPLLLIDGQQRITTLTLLIAALADYARSHPEVQMRFDQVIALVSLSSDCLIWDELGADKKTRSLAARLNVNFADDDWQDMYAWMVEQMWKLSEVMQEFDK